MSTPTDPAPYLRLLEALSEYTSLLRDLKYKVDVVRAVAAKDMPDALDRAVTECEHAHAALKAFEGYHAIAREHVATALGVPADEVTMSLLVARAPQRFRPRFSEYGTELDQLAHAINVASTESQRLVADKLATLKDGIHIAAGRPASVTYDRSGRPAQSATSQVAGQL